MNRDVYLASSLIRKAYQDADVRQASMPLLYRIARTLQVSDLVNVLPLAELTYKGSRFVTGKPVRFHCTPGRIHKPFPGEPLGEYVVADEDGTEVRLRKPLVLNWGKNPNPKSWVGALFSYSGGKRGSALSRQLRKDHFDGIVLIRRRKPYQIILLREELGEDPGVTFQELFPDAPKVTPVISTESKYVSNFPGTPEEAYEATVQNVLGHSAPSSSVAMLSGLAGLQGLGEFDVTVKLLSKNVMQFQVKGPHLKVMSRTVSKLPDGRVQVYNDYLHLTDSAPRGIGTKIFYSQVLACKEAGIDEIACEAARQDPDYTAADIQENISQIEDEILGIEMEISEMQEDPDYDEEDIEEMYDDLADQQQELERWKLKKPDAGLIGYLVWPKMGYNARLIDLKNWDGTAKLYENSKLYGTTWEELLPKLVRQKLFLGKITKDTPLEEITLLDMTQTEKGRQWWVKHGASWDAAFDLNPQDDGTPSRSVELLNAYVQRRAERDNLDLKGWVKKIGSLVTGIWRFL